MVQGMKVQDLLQDGIYQPGNIRGTYFHNLAFLEEHLGAEALADYAVLHPSRADSAFPDLFWWTMSESYPAFRLPTEALPRVWLAHAKYAIAHDYLPSNFYDWALAILEWFDLERYRQAHQLQLHEYEAIAADLKSVVAKLATYPKDKLRPAWPEDQWGLG